MKLAGVKASGYFSKPDKNHSAILIYGADAMRVSLRRQELLTALVGKEASEEMRLTRISGAELKKEPSLVMDGMKAQGFFPGPRAVFLEEAGDGLAPILEMAVKEWQPGDAILVVTANQLNARSKLRKVFEAPQNTMAIGIYNDPPSAQEVLETARKVGLSNFEASAKDDLLSLGRELDPGDLQQTIEKLALYKLNDETAISSHDIEICAPATVDAGVDEALNAVAEARSKEVGPLLKRLLGQGVNPTTLCISAMRHYRTLHQAAAHAQGPDVALSRARPPVFGARKDRMVRQTRAWGLARLEKALDVLIDLDLTLRSSQQAPDRALLERAFIRISMLRPK